MPETSKNAQKRLLKAQKNARQKPVFASLSTLDEMKPPPPACACNRVETISESPAAALWRSPPDFKERFNGLLFRLTLLLILRMGYCPDLRYATARSAPKGTVATENRHVLALPTP